MTTTTQDAQLVKCPLPQYNFRCLLVHRPTGEEICELISLDTDRFLVVLAEVNKRFPGWALVESWEVTLPEPDEF